MLNRVMYSLGVGLYWEHDYEFGVAVKDLECTVTKITTDISELRQRVSMVTSNPRMTQMSRLM